MTLDGAPKTLRNPKNSKVPIKPLPLVLCEKANEYPQKNHWKIHTAEAIIEAQSKDKACFFLDKPEYNKPIPGTIIHTPAEATPIHPMLAKSNCVFKSVVNELPPVPSPVGVPVKL